jgi:hypothetical protein
VIYSYNRAAATRAQGRVQVGREFSACCLRKLARFLAAQTHARLKEEEEIMRLVISLISNYPGSNSFFCELRNLFSSSLKRAWVRGPKKRANRLSL